ncbi:aspartate carbamoyltransferase [Shewanella sediminis HAW-EB3]|uniref:Aspartate carbamoyltransferase n=1 Tax=Shewanella sediminis (strain HAW-EB3) TaxID=425104 RepID=A8FX32_SHESH|nr:DmsC/YnfH family molybdoenzyme membrane anchor subunit [Shewanella sediminis]ABV37405.1 aspartate carbamoyltransferase [Shewanella sediminis HAW-EB3]
MSRSTIEGATDKVSPKCGDVGVYMPGKTIKAASNRPEVGQEQLGRSNHWEVRPQEQAYAYLPDPGNKSEIENRYGKRIDLVELTDNPVGRSLFINGNPEVGTNPDRNKQHGFFFTADNCIGCHACESACSEKNDNPAHLAFRSVGYVEGGTYPDHKRMNISMACNHCDDPVCLKGCPTRAYTKHAEYGAVLQDPETCFGCGYCTWVCPYNAPQLDPVEGRVSKCNMCVDRLEVGLKPACVSACLGNALDFGVIENTPENREQCKTTIPGFPSPEITQPNIRFQQTKSLPEEMTRTDDMPVKYCKGSDGQYRPKVDQKVGKKIYWNLPKLNSRENPLVLFTLLVQAALGTFIIPFSGALFGVETFKLFMASNLFLPLVLLSLGMTSLGLFMSVTHLGRPFRFYRGFNNLRYSPMSREGFGLALFSAFLGLTALLLAPSNLWVNTMLTSLGLDLTLLTSTLPLENGVVITGLLASASGLAGLYYMNQCYQIKARPFWNHWQTATSFVGNSLSLGAMVSCMVMLLSTAVEPLPLMRAVQAFGFIFTAGLVIEAVGLIGHNRTFNRSEDEGGAAHYIQCTSFGKTYLLRNVLLAVNILAASGLLLAGFLEVSESPASQSIANEPLYLIAWASVSLINLITAMIGRALFYNLVIPTTMPGAFFWKNKGFEQHARDIGLADNPATGVAPLAH